MKIKELRQLHGTISSGSLFTEWHGVDRKKRIDRLGFSARVRHALRARHIETLEQLLELTPFQLRHIRNIGVTSAQEVEEFLAQRGLSLKPDLVHTEACCNANFKKRKRRQPDEILL